MNRIETEVNEMIPTARTSIIHKMSPKDLFILATTSSGIGVVISGVFAAYHSLWSIFHSNGFMMNFHI